MISTETLNIYYMDGFTSSFYNFKPKKINLC